MKKSIFLSAFFALTLMSFAFKPNHSSAIEKASVCCDVLDNCCGTIEASAACWVPGGAGTITVTDNLGNVILTAPANGQNHAITLAPGNYTVTLTSNAYCVMNLGWDLCQVAPPGNPFTVTPTAPVNVSLVIVDINC